MAIKVVTLHLLDVVCRLFCLYSFYKLLKNSDKIDFFVFYKGGGLKMFFQNYANFTRFLTFSRGGKFIFRKICIFFLISNVI